jgi:polyhydroxyalkanoate synthesis regulator phasin
MNYHKSVLLRFIQSGLEFERILPMKSVVMKSIYAGLGLLGTGKESIEEIGRKLAKKASLSEKEGERIARELQARSEKAIKSLQKTLEKEVDQVVHALHAAAANGKTHAQATKHKAAARRAKRTSAVRHKVA